MGMKGKLELGIEIKSSGDLFHELWAKNPTELCNIIPDKIHSYVVLEGDLGNVGTVLHKNYSLGGKKCYDKEILEEVNEKEKYVKFKLIEGDNLTNFKTLTAGIHVICEGETTIVNWIIEFEKIRDDGPYPTPQMDYCIQLTREIEAYHIKKA